MASAYYFVRTNKVPETQDFSFFFRGGWCNSGGEPCGGTVNFPIILSLYLKKEKEKEKEKMLMRYGFSFAILIIVFYWIAGNCIL